MFKYKEYELGPEIEIYDVPEKTVTIGDVVKLMFNTDGVDDKIRFTITSHESGRSIFSGRNMHLYRLPLELSNAPIIAMDDVGDENGINFYISTLYWKHKVVYLNHRE